MQPTEHHSGDKGSGKQRPGECMGNGREQIDQGKYTGEQTGSGKQRHGECMGNEREQMSARVSTRANRLGKSMGLQAPTQKSCGSQQQGKGNGGRFQQKSCDSQTKNEEAAGNKPNTGGLSGRMQSAPTLLCSDRSDEDALENLRAQSRSRLFGICVFSVKKTRCMILRHEQQKMTCSHEQHDNAPAVMLTPVVNRMQPGWDRPQR